MLTKRYQLLLLAVVLLTAFYPATLADFSRIDDSGLRDALEQMRGWDLRSIFTPFTGGSYYRPLLIASFVLDKHLGLYPGLMHLENILLHLMNAILVYFLALFVLPLSKSGKSLLPLVAALVFGLHPVNSESVNWISGRTDLMAGAFILSSVLLLLRYRQNNEKKYVVLSVIAFLCGILSKETAVAFLPGFFLLMSYREGANVGSTADHHASTYEPTAKRIFFAIGAAALVLMLFVLRTSTLSHHDNRINMTLRYISNDWIHSLLVTLRAFGFYIKKLIVPYPLNFAILEVDPLYEVLGVPLAVMCIYIATRRTMSGTLFLTGVCLIVPSFILAFNQIAWTPYAERYVYIASALLILSIVVSLKDSGVMYRPWLSIAVIIVLVIAFLSTFSRSIVWLDDLALCRDTVEKSPLSRNMRVTYSGLLSEKGDYSEALRQLEHARTIPFFGYDEKIDMGTAYVYYKQGKIDDAIALSETVLRRTDGQSSGALDALVVLLTNKKRTMKGHEGRAAVNRKIYAYAEKLFKMNDDPLLLFQLADIARELGEQDRAVELLKQSIDRKADDEFYRQFAMNKIRRLSDGSSDTKR